MTIGVCCTNGSSRARHPSSPQAISMLTTRRLTFPTTSTVSMSSFRRISHVPHPHHCGKSDSALTTSSKAEQSTTQGRPSGRLFYSEKLVETGFGGIGQRVVATILGRDWLADRLALSLCTQDRVEDQ